jgi:hypothetical protein
MFYIAGSAPSPTKLDTFHLAAPDKILIPHAIQSVAECFSELSVYPDIVRNLRIILARYHVSMMQGMNLLNHDILTPDLVETLRLSEAQS